MKKWKQYIHINKKAILLTALAIASLVSVMSVGPTYAYLKIVNDTKGHAAGDKLIKDASALLREYFVHGTVYRTGGDEFVVLLQEKGYDTREETIRSLNEIIEANIATDGVVISMGYSALEPNDERLHDVFERADRMMYERKKELKQMGAKTREA